MKNYKSIWEITDVVVHGRGLGSSIDMPTVNFVIDPSKHENLPKYGVYGSIVLLPNKEQMFGVSNLGLCPTVSNSQECRLETHIIDFDGDLYGKELNIRLVKFLRETKKFESLEQLKSQIYIDKCWYIK